jgi:ABC-type Mn2+/Zn2+ transport system permease subunit
VAAGGRISHSFRSTLWWAVGVGGLSSVVGLGVAAAHGELVPGGTIVLASIALFLVFAAIGARSHAHRPRRSS